MQTYHKIQSMFKRDPATKYKTFIDGEWTLPEFEALQDLRWRGTEKIDGTNIRIGWDGERVHIGGRTENAQIPAPLLEHISERISPELESGGLGAGLTLVGEGFGGKIQKGRYYRPTQEFILFDVFVEPTETNPLGMWLSQTDVREVAASLYIQCVPTAFVGTLLEACDYVSDGPLSLVAEEIHKTEGLVLRPPVELRTRRGHRVITKLKVRDFYTA